MPGWHWLMTVAASPVASGTGFQPSWVYSLTALLLPMVLGAGLAGLVSLVEKITGQRLGGGSL